jgi:hypothetical protein
MDIHLSFQDFSKLAASGRLEKDGTPITFGRPVLAEIEINPKAKTGKVCFFSTKRTTGGLPNFDCRHLSYARSDGCCSFAIAWGWMFPASAAHPIRCRYV